MARGRLGSNVSGTNGHGDLDPVWDDMDKALGQLFMVNNTIECLYAVLIRRLDGLGGNHNHSSDQEIDQRTAYRIHLAHGQESQV